MADEKYRLQLEGSQVDDALLQMNQRVPEGWAVGTRDGVPVGSGSQFYHNNAKYYAEQAGGSLDAANAAAARAEAAVPAGTEGAVLFTVDQSDIMTEAQKAIARNNIDAASASDSNVVKATPQTFTPAQQAQARANIMAGGSNDNLLDNAYFVGGGSQLGDGVFPINQRGQTSYTGGYGIDRWRCWQASTVTLTAAGMTFATGANSDGLFQYFHKGKFESLYGETVTASLLLTDGTLYTATGTASADCWIATSFSGGYFGYICNGTEANFRISLNANQSKSIKACKLEKGTYSTLLNDVAPDFGEELRKCQRYFVRFSPKVNSRAYIGTGSANNSNNMLIFVPTPVTLRTTPTISYSNCNCYNWVAGGSIALNGINLDSWSDNGVFVSCAPSDTSQAPQGQPYALRVASGGFFDLSCEP